MFWYIIFGLFTSSCGIMDGEPCGLPKGCFCSAPILHEITCTNVTVFPFFPAEMKAGVITVKFFRTMLVNLFPFWEKDWPSLHELVFKDNTLLGCEVIEHLQRDGLEIYSDCPRVPTTSSGAEPIMPILGCISFVLTLGTILSAIVVKYKKKEPK